MTHDAPDAGHADFAAPTVILMVEDSVVLRSSSAHYLRHLGYVVIETGRAAEALQVLASGLAIELVFTDVQMPGELDGVALGALLAREYPKLPVILTSGAGVASHSGPLGPLRHFLLKPYDLDEVDKLITQFLGRSVRQSADSD